HHSWQAVAPGLKTIAEAADIRSRIFLAFEAAEREPDPSRWRELLTFVVVGAGATGVELAGALAEIANQTLRNDFRRINPEDAHILLIEAGPRVLANYSESLSKKAEDSIRKLGIDLRLGTKVVEIGEDHIGLEDAQGPQDIRTRTVLWAAGVQASPLGRSLAEGCQVACDRSGRVPVEPNLSVLGHPNVFVIGDLAACPGANGKPLPGVAPVAIQQGAFVADWLAKRAAGKPTPTAFAYRDRGSMATIGRAAAVAQIGKRRFTGFFAWIMWLLVHLMLIVQFQNRVMVLMQWAWYYLTFNRSARLITTRPDREAPKGPV
ncbi:MAG: NAD(P)/FAD-dependent oxidoreductase, partial [Planctomycetes bacterium]|nr:NAD(P)/FAD-dependent oxidoreductase [Planctomycetota bacterium]